MQCEPAKAFCHGSAMIWSRLDKIYCEEWVFRHHVEREVQKSPGEMMVVWTRKDLPGVWRPDVLLVR